MCWNRIKAWVHKWHVAEWLRAVRRWMADWDAMDKNHTLLSPKILSPNNKEDKIDEYRYSAVRELRNAINSDRCNNIAITGVYGSGKSSVIQTYLAELCPRFRKRKVLSISLSNFCDTDNLKTYGAPTKYENDIEQKLFQHILYKTNQNKTRQTRYGRISHISVEYGVIISIMILLGILGILYLFFPSILVPKHLFGWYVKSIGLGTRHTIHFWADICAIAYLSFLFVVCVTYMIRRFHQYRLSGRIRADKVELEWEKESSKFDKLLGEILYFFKAGGYRIVIFEDLDRIKTPEKLFLKLREINVLLNESDYYKRWHRRIKFVYAIRDDVFRGDVRTKCFDYIIPIVPIVDKYNAVDYMLCHYRDGIFRGIEESALAAMGLFIGSKRELTNIINEFATYYKSFTENEGDKEKLLAMLIYKNAFPEDYAAAFMKQGCLCAVFSDKCREKLYHPFVTRLEAQKKEYDNNINMSLQSLQTCRHKLIVQLEEDGVLKLATSDGDYFDLNMFVEKDWLYELLEHDKLSKYVTDDGNQPTSHEYDYKFDDLIKKAYPEGRRVYEEEMRSASVSLFNNIVDRDRVGREIEVLKSQAIKELISMNIYDEAKRIFDVACEEVYRERYQDAADKYKDLLNQNCNLLFTFVRQGFIENDYASYMSHSYPGSMTDEEAAFVNSVLKGNFKSYKQSLTHLDAIVRCFNSNNYEQKCILNIALVDYITDQGDSAKMGQLAETARKYPDFISEYTNRKGYREQFLDVVFTKWHEAVQTINSIEDDTVRESLFKLYWKAAPIDVGLRPYERDIVEQMYSFICQHMSILDETKLEKYIAFYGMRFTDLELAGEDTKPLYDYVVRGKYFAITYGNLHIIYGDAFDKAAFTQIYEGNEDIRAYMIENTNKILGFVSDSSVEEAPSTILSLLNNLLINPAKLNPYLCKQKKQIDSKGVLADAIIPPLLDVDLICPTWDNVSNCITRLTDETSLVKFIHRNIEELTKKKCECENVSDIESLILVSAKEFSEEEFTALAECFTKLLTVEQIESLSEEYLRILNEMKMLEFSDDMMVHLESVSSKLLGRYLVLHYEDFMNIEDDDPVEITNAIGMEILNSELSPEKKKRFIKVYPFDAEGDDAEEYAPLYCAFCEQERCLANIEELIAAMEAYPAPKEDAVSWRIHISLVNQINRARPYDRATEARMVTTIGDYYGNLNILYNREKEFDKNPENEELLEYLKVNKHYVSKVSETEEGKLYVTFRHKLIN